MKSAPIALALMFVCTGCPNVEDLLTYERDVEQEITVPGTGVGVGNNPLVADQVFPIDFGAAISDSLDQSFSTEGIQKNAVSSLTITALRLEVTNPEDDARVKDLEFIESAKFLLAAENADAVLVAESEPDVFQDGTLEYDFPVTENELVDVLNGGDEMMLDSDVEFDEDNRATFATDVLFTATLKVIADPVGALN